MFPLPEKENLNNYYEEDYWEKHHNVTGLVNKIETDSFDSRNKAIFEWIAPYVKDTNSRVLEIGAGFGHTLAYIKHKTGCQVEGVEPSKEGTYNAVHSYGIETYNGFWEDFQPKSKYDVVILSHVLEHFANPDEAIAKISLHMNTWGALFTEVPNVLFPNPRKHKLGWFSKEHISYFSKDKLNYLLVKNGFNMKRSEEKTYLRTLSLLGKDNGSPKWKNESLKVRLAVFRHDMLYYKMRLLQKLKLQK